ncbi:MAG: hypothetical protein KDE56_12895 [Anaerolineales bacterium]|nr:hypothetical protein [Anaerolineales bacterium]
MHKFAIGVALTAVFLMLAWSYPQFHTVDAQQPVRSAQATTLVDDFETGLPLGQDTNGLLVGYFSWQNANATIAINTTTTPPAPVPGASANNHVLGATVNIGSNQVVGFSHTFTNSNLDQWLSQDWRSYEGVSFWLYGRNSGGTIFIDIMDNRNPGSTTDDAERWSVNVTDDFAGWQFFEIPFTDFTRKELNNNAPNDGFGRSEVWGYTVGFFGSAPLTNETYFFDKFGLSEPPACYPLSLTHTGSGSDPIPSLTNSVGCTAGNYHADEQIELTAIPAAGWRVKQWQGSDNDSSKATTNLVTMPNAAWIANVAYEPIPTATPSPSPTATTTPTATATATATATPTITPTPSPDECAFSENGRLPHCIFLPFIHYPYFRGPQEAEPNDSNDEANGLILANVIYQGTMSSPADSSDYYAFRLYQPGTAELVLSQIPAGHNYNLILRNAALEVLPGGNSGNIGNADEHIGPLHLPAGLYYIQIFNRSQSGSTQPYQLRVVYP